MLSTLVADTESVGCSLMWPFTSCTTSLTWFDMVHCRIPPNQPTNQPMKQTGKQTHKQTTDNQTTRQPTKQPNRQTITQQTNRQTKAVNHLAHIHKPVHGGGAERLRHGGTTPLNSEIFGLQFYRSKLEYPQNKNNILILILFLLFFCQNIPRQIINSPFD